MFLTKKHALKKYEEEKRNVTARIIKRQTRGNVCVQNGGTNFNDKLYEQSLKADKLLAGLIKLVPQA